MPIRFFLEPDHAFNPGDVKLLVDAFEDTLRELHLTNREDPVATRVAKGNLEQYALSAICVS